MPPCLAWPGRHRKSDGRPLEGDRYAYRVLWEAAHGPLGRRVLHHRCGHCWCVQLAHLVPMTRRQHLAEHHQLGDRCQAAKTHCPAGHAYDEANTYRWRGERQCRTCRAAGKRRRRALAGTRQPASPGPPASAGGGPW